MRRLINPVRMAVFFIITALVLTVYVAALYKLQLYDDAEPVDEILANSVTTTETLKASRGDILDRNGTLLISSESCYNITLLRDAILGTEDPNAEILKIIYAAMDAGVDYTDTFPVSKTAPFSYVDPMSDYQSYLFYAYLDFFELDHDISASDLIIWMKNHYDLGYAVPLMDARMAIGVRWEMEMRVILNIDPYVFVENAGTDFISVLKESGCVGISVGVSESRVYHTEYAAHLLGYVGYLDDSDIEEYESLGYPMNAQVGKDGAEYAFESYLHGADGTQEVIRSSDGYVINTQTVKEAIPGSNVYLTIDIGLQKAAEDALESKITEINSNREPDKMVTGGAVVVLKADTSELLAAASNPTYDINTLLDNYSALINDSGNPLYNRATMGEYNPGSTFKMTTALAGLRKGFISRWTTYNDIGYYDAYAEYNYSPWCWIYPITGHGHGELDVVGALQNSCNSFFFWVGDHVGIDAIEQACADFGFGSPTGLEIPESAGLIASDDYKETVIGEDWYAADNLITAIGQGYTAITPLQLANYAATIANGGTRGSVSMLSKVRSADYSEVVYTQPHETAYSFDAVDRTYIAILQEGMEAVSHGSGSAAEVFQYYRVPVAAKTGTVETGADTNDGLFVCYAPADDPEIAIAIVVEKGRSGTSIMAIAKDVMDYYFAEADVDFDIVYSGGLIR